MYKCGIDIGGTNIKFGVFENEKKVSFFKIKTPNEKNEIVPAIANEIKSRFKLSDILGYSIAIPGVLKDGVVVYAPNTNIVGLHLMEEFKNSLENNNIIIENDANLQALAEARNSKVNDLILLTIGTGLGGGIIIDGNVHNKNGYAGEIGHIKVHFGNNTRKCTCGKLGCSEAYVSCSAIVKEYNDIKGTSINSKELFDLAKQGDKLAFKCINDCAKYTAITIADIVAVLGIKTVRIAGGLSNAGEFFLRRVRAHYPKYSVKNMEDISISRASLKYEAGVYAALYVI